MDQKCPYCGAPLTDSSSPYCPKCLLIVNKAPLEKSEDSVQAPLRRSGRSYSGSYAELTGSKSPFIFDIDKKIQEETHDITAGQIIFLILLLLAIPFIVWPMILSILDGSYSGFPIFQIIFLFFYSLFLIYAVLSLDLTHSNFKDYSSDFREIPIYKRLSAFGDPKKIAESIEDEVNNKVNFYHNTGVLGQRIFLTERWLIDETPNTFALDRTEIIWVYKTATKHSMNLIPTHTTYRIDILSILKNSQDEHPIFVDFDRDDEKATDFIIEIHRFAPGAFYGASQENQDLWNNTRRTMVQTVNHYYQ